MTDDTSGDDTSGDDTSDEEPAMHDEHRESDADAPLSDLAGRRRARREERESAGADAEATADDPFSALGAEADATGHESAGDSNAFEQMDVEPVDSEDVWSDLLDGDDPATGDSPEVGEPAESGVPVEGAAPTELSADTESVGEQSGHTATAGGASATAGTEFDTREEHVIPKTDYCQQCAYFTDPPAVACEHEGTDIVSVEDFEHFRVRGCPVVENEFDPDEGNY